jgi:DNA-binding NarL/FixJ family response regulator
VRTKVVILSGHSLFVEGVASRLSRHLDHLDLHVIDADSEATLAKIISLEPAAVILDTTDPVINQYCPLGDLLKALPQVTVIRLDPQQAQVQVVTSKEHALQEVDELIAVIETLE